jgi:hypothetical protein
MITQFLRYVAACLLLVLCATSLSLAQEWMPRKIVDAFFDRSGIKNKKLIYSGEMLENYLDKPTMGQMLAPDTTVDDIRLLEQTKGRAIYAVAISNKGRVYDYYIYLERKTAWKLAAVRTLWLSGFFSSALEELEKKEARTPAEEAQYQNMLLTMKSDKDLKRYFSANIGKLQAIADAAKNGDMKKADTLADELNLNKVFKQEDYPGIIEINIGGMLDNGVGFLYVPDGKKPPAMSSGGYIYIEKVIEHWYLYKTT